MGTDRKTSPLLWRAKAETSGRYQRVAAAARQACALKVNTITHAT